jgi:F420-dependent oxidoreductase-like protein
MRAPIQLDLHLPNFNYPGVGPDAAFEKLVEIATTAERAGFSAVTVMDHYHQIPTVGPPENWMFEGNTILAGIAARTESIALGLLVGGVTYRNPAQHAKITTGIDVISGGRAFHGIGAAWFDGEHVAYGYDFPPLGERFEHLEDHLRIARAMFTEEQATVAGTHHSVTDAYNNPKVRGDIPIVIGGSGERKTLRMVAQYADGCNFFGDAERARHLLGVLEGHCERLGRDPAEITKTVMMSSLAIGQTQDEVQGKIARMREIGIAESRITAAPTGTPEQIQELAQAYREAGVEGVTLSLPDVHDPEAIMLAGETLAPLFNAERQPAV